MVTKNKFGRQLRAIEIVQKRIDFWMGLDSSGVTEIPIDGKLCSVPTKLSQAEFEMSRLKAITRH